MGSWERAHISRDFEPDDPLEIGTTAFGHPLRNTPG
jgi:hypothetical protein